MSRALEVKTKGKKTFKATWDKSSLSNLLEAEEIEKIIIHLAPLAIEDNVGSLDESNSEEYSNEDSSSSDDEVTSLKKCYPTIICLNRSLKKIKR